MEADFPSRTRSRSDLYRFRLVHGRMNECWFALYARCQIGNGGQSRFSLNGH
jgi:hypothetical protein